MHCLKDRHVTTLILLIMQTNDTYLWIFCAFVMKLDTQHSHIILQVTILFDVFKPVVLAVDSIVK
jgi:hypothetical protein